MSALSGQTETPNPHKFADVIPEWRNDLREDIYLESSIFRTMSSIIIQDSFLKTGTLFNKELTLIRQGGANGPSVSKSLISGEPKVGLTSNQAVNLSLSIV